MAPLACASQANPHAGRDGAELMLLYACKLLTRSNAALQNQLVRVLFAFPFTSWATIMDILPQQTGYEPGPEHDWYA